MTSLAQFRDCHSCYDERSIDQKKKSSLSSLVLKQQQAIASHLVLAVVLWQLHELQMELLSCTASSTGTWVNQLATLVEQLG